MAPGEWQALGSGSWGTGPCVVRHTLTKPINPSLPQVMLLLQRGLTKYLRSFWPLKVIDILLLLASAFIIGGSHTRPRASTRERSLSCCCWISPQPSGLISTPLLPAGFIHSTKWDLGDVPSNVVMFMTCLGVLSTVTHLRTFSNDRLLQMREAR